MQNSFDFGSLEAGGNYYFYDLNFKLVHKLSQKDQINFSFYSGSDNFSGMVTEEEEGVNMTIIGIIMEVQIMVSCGAI